jgi:hypothetical protein
MHKALNSPYALRNVYKPTALRNHNAVKRASVIGIILGASLISLWLLLAWLGKTEPNYRQPEPGLRYGIPNEIKQTNSAPRIYQPSRFADGELSTYKIKLFGLPIGKCTFKAQLVDQNATSQWHFEMHAGANGLPVQYDARSIVNGAFTHSIEYHTVQKDRASRKVDLTFDEKTHKVKRLLNGNPNGETATEKNTLDPLSIIFKFREMDLDQPGEVQSHVSDGKKTFPAKITVIGKEEIEIGDQTYQAILVEPDLGEMRGVFNKDPDAKMHIWLSDDAHRVPLCIKTKISIGRFTMELEKYDRPD